MLQYLLSHPEHAFFPPEIADLCEAFDMTVAVLQGRAPIRKRPMARKYSRSASKDVKSAMRKRKRGTLKRGMGGRGGKVKSGKQAIAIGLSEARRKGKKVPERKSKR